jgi:uncharacterized membrane protein YtjA (UPF0391 family)
LISIVAGILGFTGVSAAAGGIAHILFIIFIIVFIVFLPAGRRDDFLADAEFALSEPRAGAALF